MTNLANLLDLEDKPTVPGPGNSPGGNAIGINPKDEHQATQWASGVFEGIADTLGISIDLVRAGFEREWDDRGNPIGPDRPPTSEDIRRFFHRYGLIGPEAKTISDRIVRRTSQEIGATLVTLPLLPVRIGAKGVQWIGGAARELGRKKATRLVSDQLIMSAGAGVGAGGAKVLTPNDANPMLGTVSELAAGVVGGALTGAGIGVAPQIRATKNRLMSTGRTLAETQIKSSVPDIVNAQQNLSRASQLQQTIPGFSTTTAQATNSTALQTLERSIASESPAFTNQLAELQHANRDAFIRYIKSVEPPQADKNSIKRALQARAVITVDALGARISAAEEQIQTAMKNGAITTEEASRAAKAIMSAAEDEFQAHKNILYAAVDPENISRFETRPLKKLAEEIIKEGHGRPKENTPSEILNIITATVKEGGTVPSRAKYSRMRELSADIGQQIRAEESKPESARNRDLIRNLTRLDVEINRIFDETFSAAEYAGISERYEKAQAFFSEGANIFRYGPMAKTLREGHVFVPDSATLDYFFHAGRGAPEAAQRYIKAVGGRDGASMAIRDYAVALVYKQATDINGKLDSNRLRIFLKKYSAALGEFPEVRKEIESLSALQNKIDTLYQRQSRVHGVIDRGSAQLFIEGDVSGAIKRVFNSNDPAGEARLLWRRTASNKEAQAGLRRLLWDELMSATLERGGDSTLDNPFLDPKKLRDFVDANKDVFKAFGYTDKDLMVIDNVVDAGLMAERTKPPTSVTPRTESGRTSLWSINTFWSRAFGFKRGVVGAPYLFAESTSRNLAQFLHTHTLKQFYETIEEALIDPSFAADLLLAGRSSDSVSGNAGIRVWQHLIATGIVTEKPAERRRD